jgi:hypothetical protein
MTVGETMEVSILIKALPVDSGRLYVNDVARPGGYLKAELTDKYGNALPGYELNSSKDISGENLRAPML